MYKEIVIKDKNALTSESILVNGENIYKDNIIMINDIAQEPDTSCNHLNKEYYLAKGFLVLSEKEAYKTIHENNLLKYIKDFSEISEDSYFNNLEMLPPKNFKSTPHGNIFLISEYTYLNVTGVVVEHKGRYFKACKVDTIHYDTHIENIEAKFFNVDEV